MGARFRTVAGGVAGPVSYTVTAVSIDEAPNHDLPPGSPAPAPRPAQISQSDLVFNIVWIGSMFRYLQPFTASLIDQSDTRFRFVANGVPAEEFDLLSRFRAAHPDRVIEVIEVCPDGMQAHGVALDRLRDIRDDGSHFCLIDPDIKAKGPWVDDFIALLGSHDVVTSGTEVWSTDNMIPEGHPGVAGEYYYDSNGFCFGSPHLALYRRSAIDETCARWGVGLGSAGPDLNSAATAKMASMGHDKYYIFDTGKILNALLQGDGSTLLHVDFPQLVHIGGLAHFLQPSWHVTDAEGEEIPEWGRHAHLADRLAVTRFTAATLRSLIDDHPVPDLPTGLDPTLIERQETVRDEVVEMVERYRDWLIS